MGNVPPPLLIVDEAHYCKHKTAQRTKHVFGSTGLAHQVLDAQGRVWCLSGTPMPRNPSELWPVLMSLWPVYLTQRGFGSYTAWLNRFCVWHTTPYGIKVFGAKHPAELRELLQPILLRRKTADVVPDLPRLRWNVLSITAENVGAVDATLPLETREALLRGELPPVDEHIARYRHEVGDLKAPYVADLIADELRNDARAKRVVFAFHHSVLDVLARELQPFGLVQIRGDTPAWRRQDAVRAFREQDETRVFLGQLNACATGMDGLQYAAHECVMVEPDWKTDVNTQAGHRLARLGQPLPVQVRMISLAQTLDESIIRNHVRECRMVADVLG
jgi:SNF2 family DNA or RNA helicase